MTRCVFKSTDFFRYFITVKRGSREVGHVKMKCKVITDNVPRVTFLISRFALDLSMILHSLYISKLDFKPKKKVKNMKGFLEFWCSCKKKKKKKENYIELTRVYFKFYVFNFIFFFLSFFFLRIHLTFTMKNRKQNGKK